MVTVYVLYLNNSFRSLTGDGGFGLMGVLARRMAPSPAGSTVRWKVKVGCNASLYNLTAVKDKASACRCDWVNSLIWGKMRFKRGLLQVHYGRGNIINVMRCVCSRLTCSSPPVSSICYRPFSLQNIWHKIQPYCRDNAFDLLLSNLTQAYTLQGTWTVHPHHGDVPHTQTLQ